MSRVLIVGLNYAPEPVGIGPYTTGLAEALAEAGHAVTAVVGQPYYPQWRKDPAYAGGWRRSTEQGVTVIRCPHYVPREPTGRKRMLHLASFALSALLPALRTALAKDRPQVVIAIAPALLSVITAWLAARLSGAKLWVHVQDFEVEAALATGLLGKRGRLVQFALWLEARLLRLANRVSTISPQMVARLLAKGVAADRALELRNWADPRFAIDPEGAEALRADWGIGARKVALYSGNIARKQGIEILIEAARLLTERSDLAFVICGEGPNRAELARRAKDLHNIQLHDLQPAARMGALLGLADVHLLPQIAGAADLVLPSKLTNMLASGRPVVATAELGTGLADEVTGCGLITPPGDAEAVARAIAALLDDPDHRAVLGQAALVRAQQRWAKPAIIARWESELARLLGGN
jgi:colanic acid biosynthesis glycosyl transferase WcaI